MSSKLEGEKETTNNEEWAQCCAWWHEPVTQHGTWETGARLPRTQGWSRQPWEF